MLIKQRPHVSEGEPAHLFEHAHGGEVSLDELPANFSALAALEVSQLFSLRVQDSMTGATVGACIALNRLRR